ncbi:MAG: hypothetical protein Q8L14_12375 [Myxococcales bacterium]|nr:hypothetical protein [Myxococcales bacterium]
MKTRLKPRRGVAMVAVLIALLLLTTLASGFFLQARDSGSLNDISMGQSVAVTNAEMGMQEAIRRVRSAQFDTALITPCLQMDVDNNTCGSLSSGIISGPNNNPLTGGGLLYQFMIYRRAEADPSTAAAGASPTVRYVVRTTGYYGRTLGSASLVTSVLEAEVEMGSGNKTTCRGSYGDCF